MRTVQVKDKPTTLAGALSEIGRIAKTVDILHYIDDATSRRRILTQLNHTELRHRLGRRILNAVVHWNAIYMQEALRQARPGRTEWMSATTTSPTSPR